MREPRISVIMSTYNEPLKWITESIDSILNQTFRDFEFIIINDNPKRKELQEFLEKYKKQDKRIILIKNKKNSGPAIARNNGLKIAKGKYIAIMDADDISLPERFEIQYDYLEKHKDVFLVGSGWYEIDQDNNHIKTSKKIRTPFKNLDKHLKKSNYIHNPTVMFRNDQLTFYRNKFRYAQDYDLWLNLITQNKKLTNLSEHLIKYRHNLNSISFKNRTKQKLFMNKAKEFYDQRIEYGKDEYEKFDPNEILNLDIEKSKDKGILKLEIKASFKINNLQKARRYCKKYFEYYGYFNKMFIYYLASFLSKNTINFLRKVVFG